MFGTQTNQGEMESVPLVPHSGSGAAHLHPGLREDYFYAPFGGVFM